MKSDSYLVLNSWLQKSDSNYIAGRLLWFQLLVHGGCNLLWLSCEQLMKIVLLQSRIDDIGSDCTSLEEKHAAVNSAGKELGHSVRRITEAIDKLYPDLEISEHRCVLDKLHEYFFRRYPAHKGSSVSLEMIHQIDTLYFQLRSLVLSEVGLGVIDEIYIQRKHRLEHPLPAFKFAYSRNLSFRSRSHTTIAFRGSNGEKISEDGSN